MNWCNMSSIRLLKFQTQMPLLWRFLLIIFLQNLVMLIKVIPISNFISSVILVFGNLCHNVMKQMHMGNMRSQVSWEILMFVAIFHAQIIFSNICSYRTSLGVQPATLLISIISCLGLGVNMTPVHGFVISKGRWVRG